MSRWSASPIAKWGERVHAVIVPHEGDGADRGRNHRLVHASRIAGYKRPRSVSFIGDDEMPRTATGKIQHRLLRCSRRAAEADCARARGNGHERADRNAGPQRRRRCPARPGSRAFSKRAASTASSACRAATSSRSGIMSRGTASASSTCATKARRCTWRMRTPSSTGGFGVAMVDRRARRHQHRHRDGQRLARARAGVC